MSEDSNVLEFGERVTIVRVVLPGATPEECDSFFDGLIAAHGAQWRETDEPHVLEIRVQDAAYAQELCNGRMEVVINGKTILPEFTSYVGIWRASRLERAELRLAALAETGPEDPDVSAAELEQVADFWESLRR